MADRKPVEQILLAAMAIIIKADPNLLRPLSESKAWINPMQIGSNKKALAVVEGDNGAITRLARATERMTMLGSPPRPAAIFKAILRARVDDSIPFERMNPEIIIQSPLPP